MFERTLGDLIRGLRMNADNEAKFVSQTLDECRKELANKVGQPSRRPFLLALCLVQLRRPSCGLAINGVC